MSEIEAILLLLALMTVLVGFSMRIGIAYPIVLVLGGLAISFIPGLPHVEVEPELIFVLILPPILQSAAYFMPIQDFRTHLRPILSLAIGQVLATTCIVAVIAHWVIPGLDWPTAFVLGAIVSPPDAVAATSVASRLGLPPRVVTILEGESLLNDATALVLYRVAVAAAVTGAFSLGDAFLDFVVATIGGVIAGLLVGKVVAHIIPRMQDPSLLIAFSLLTPYAAYLLAETVHASGVLAVVVSGFVNARTYLRMENPLARLRSTAFFDTLIFLLNGFVFILIGLQLPTILEEITELSTSQLLSYALLVSLAAIFARIAWVFLIPTRLLPTLRHRSTNGGANFRERIVISWAGMRGIVSLAAALAIPIDVPNRDLIIFLTFCVILATLVIQGLSLAPLIRLLGIAGNDDEHTATLQARRVTVQAALGRLNELADEEWVLDVVADDMRQHLATRAGILDAHHYGVDETTSTYVSMAASYARLRRELLTAELAAAFALRDEGSINDATLRAIQYEIDVELLRLDQR